MGRLSGPLAKPSARDALRRPFAFVTPAKAGIQSTLRRILTFVIPAKAGIQSGLRRALKLCIDPIRPRGAGAPSSGPRGHVPVRGAWESACGWEARWNAWLASPSSPVWRGDGEQSLRR